MTKVKAVPPAVEAEADGQKIASVVKKSSTATVETKSGHDYSYAYADLATIHAEMERQGITYYQFTKYEVEAGADYIYTVLRYGDEPQGEPLRGARLILAGGNNDAQAQGSALTYARRYSLLMALGWATEDDDAASLPEKNITSYGRGSSKSRLDFAEVDRRLAECLTVEDVDFYAIELKDDVAGASEKVKTIVKEKFARRRAEMEI